MFEVEDAQTSEPIVNIDKMSYRDKMIYRRREMFKHYYSRASTGAFATSRAARGAATSE